MNIDFITLTKDNIEKEHICCAFSDKKCQESYNLKKEWLKRQFENGYVFRRLNERAKVFIEYGPAENGWVPVKADNYLLINCFWVDGKYKGSISEGDLLWGMKTLNVPGLKEAESISIMAIPRRATYKAVHADSDMEDLLDKAINQNYVPVVDDQGYFIGIITRKEIIKYCYKELKKYIKASDS